MDVTVQKANYTRIQGLGRPSVHALNAILHLISQLKAYKHPALDAPIIKCPIAINLLVVVILNSPLPQMEHAFVQLEKNTCHPDLVNRLVNVLNVPTISIFRVPDYYRRVIPVLRTH